MGLIRRLFLTLFLFTLAAPTLAQDAAAPAVATDPAAAPAAEAIPAAPTGPNELTVGVYINDIQQLDLQTHSYAMDFYVWLRWKNPDINPAAKLEYMNPFQLWGHIPTPLYEEPQSLPDGSKYMAIRYQGQFNSKLPLEKYPFDTQNLIVQFEDSSSGATKQIFVPDAEAITINPEMTLPGYILGKPSSPSPTRPISATRALPRSNPIRASPSTFQCTGLRSPTRSRSFCRYSWW
jgi:hypothetical protein